MANIQMSSSSLSSNQLYRGTRNKVLYVDIAGKSI